VPRPRIRKIAMPSPRPMASSWPAAPSRSRRSRETVDGFFTRRGDTPPRTAISLSRRADLNPPRRLLFLKTIEMKASKRQPRSHRSSASLEAKFLEGCGPRNFRLPAALRLTPRGLLVRGNADGRHTGEGRGSIFVAFDSAQIPRSTIEDLVKRLIERRLNF
jgi:hypothetical protein